MYICITSHTCILTMLNGNVVLVLVVRYGKHVCLEVSPSSGHSSFVFVVRAGGALVRNLRHTGLGRPETWKVRADLMNEVMDMVAQDAS